MKIYDFTPSNLPTELLQAIGLTVVSAEQTESIVAMFIHYLLDDGERVGRAVTSELGLPAKVKLLRALAHERVPNRQFIARLDVTLKAVEQAIEGRGPVIHGSYFRDPDTGALLHWKVTARGRVASKLSPATAAEVVAVAEAILKNGLALMSLLAERPALRKQA
jgi:hypothetical protein